MFDLAACHVERDANQDYRVSWRTLVPGRAVSVYMAESPEAFYRGELSPEPDARSREDAVLLRNPDPGVRHYFCLLSECGESAILAERQLSLEGTPNFRDLGGYEGESGRRLRWGKLYRSSKLSGLTEQDRFHAADDFHHLFLPLDVVGAKRREKKILSFSKPYK